MVFSTWIHNWIQNLKIASDMYQIPREIHNFHMFHFDQSVLTAETFTK